MLRWLLGTMLPTLKGKRDGLLEFLELLRRGEAAVDGRRARHGGCEVVESGWVGLGMTKFRRVGSCLRENTLPVESWWGGNAGFSKCTVQMELRRDYNSNRTGIRRASKLWRTNYHTHEAGDVGRLKTKSSLRKAKSYDYGAAHQSLGNGGPGRRYTRHVYYDLLLRADASSALTMKKRSSMR